MERSHILYIYIRLSYSHGICSNFHVLLPDDYIFLQVLSSNESQLDRIPVTKVPCWQQWKMNWTAWRRGKWCSPKVLEVIPGFLDRTSRSQNMSKRRTMKNFTFIWKKQKPWSRRGWNHRIGTIECGCLIWMGDGMIYIYIYRGRRLGVPRKPIAFYLYGYGKCWFYTVFYSVLCFSLKVFDQPKFQCRRG